MKRQQVRTSPVPRSARHGSGSTTTTGLRDTCEETIPEMPEKDGLHASSLSPSGVIQTEDCFTRWIASSKSTGPLVTSENYSWSHSRSPNKFSLSSRASTSGVPVPSPTERNAFCTHVTERSSRLSETPESSSRRHENTNDTGQRRLSSASSSSRGDVAVGTLTKSKSTVRPALQKEEDKRPLAMLSWKSSSSEDSPAEDTRNLPIFRTDFSNSGRETRDGSSSGSLSAVAVCIEQPRDAAGATIKQSSLSGNSASKPTAAVGCCCSPLAGSSQESSPQGLRGANDAEPWPRRKRARCEEPVSRIVASGGRLTQAEDSKDHDEAFCGLSDTAQGYRKSDTTNRWGSQECHIDPGEEEVPLSNSGNQSRFRQPPRLSQSVDDDRFATLSRGEQRVLSVFFRGGIAFAKLHVGEAKQVHKHNGVSNGVSNGSLNSKEGAETVQVGCGGEEILEHLDKKTLENCTATESFAESSSNCIVDTYSCSGGVPMHESVAPRALDVGDFHGVDLQSYSSHVPAPRKSSCDFPKGIHRLGTSVVSQERKTESCCRIHELDLRTASEVAPTSLLEYYVDRDIQAAADAAATTRVPFSSQPSTALDGSSFVQVHNHYQGAKFFLVVSDLNPSLINMEDVVNHVSPVL